MRPLVRCQKTAEWGRGEDSSVGRMPRAIAGASDIEACESPRRERPLTEVLGHSSCEHLVRPVHDGVE